MWLKRGMALTDKIIAVVVVAIVVTLISQSVALEFKRRELNEEMVKITEIAQRLSVLLVKAEVDAAFIEKRAESKRQKQLNLDLVVDDAEKLMYDNSIPPNWHSLPPGVNTLEFNSVHPFGSY